MATRFPICFFFLKFKTLFLQVKAEIKLRALHDERNTKYYIVEIHH